MERFEGGARISKAGFEFLLNLLAKKVINKIVVTWKAEAYVTNLLWTLT